MVASNLIYPNGIYSHLDKIYLATSTNREFKFFERKDNDGLRLLETVEAGVVLDNVGIDKKTGAVYLAGHPHSFKLLDHFKDKSKSSPSKVVKLTNNTSDGIFYGRKYQVETVWADNGDLLSGSTIATVVDGKTFISGIFTKGVLVCNKVF